MLHLVHTNSLDNIFFDLCNFLFLAIIFFYFYKKKYVEKHMFYVLILCSFSPLIVNSLLIDWWYLPDQAKYFKQAESFRDFNFTKHSKTTVYFPSLIFFLTPIPFIETINSIGFINKGLIGIFTIILYKKKIINKFYFYFLNLCPSVFFYASLSLKDTLSMLFILILALAFVYHRGYFLNIFLISLLPFIKIINSILFITFFYFYNFFLIRKYLILNYILLILIIFSCVIFYDDLLFLYNKYRLNFYIENHNTRLGFNSINFSFEGILVVIRETSYFLISPILNLDSPFKMLQVIENILLYILLTSSYIKLYKNDKIRTLFWLSAFIFAVILYGTLIFNDGTIARYRYVILVFFNFILYIENQELKKNIK